MKRLILAALFVAAPLLAQDTTAGRGGGRGRGGGGGGGRVVVVTDTARARSLFVSKDPNRLRKKVFEGGLWKTSTSTVALRSTIGISRMIWCRRKHIKLPIAATFSATC